MVNPPISPAEIDTLEELEGHPYIACSWPDPEEDAWEAEFYAPDPEGHEWGA